jgi:DNA-binding transcriptional regulator/RsmH inhibitor MraZ
VQLPAAQTFALGETVYLSPGFGPYLQARPRDRWDAYAARLAAVLEWGPVESLDSLRRVLGNAVETKIDPQHRLLIPRDLLELADLSPDPDSESREVMVVGTGICVEIWNPANLAEHERELQSRLKTVWNDVSTLMRATPAAPATAT